MIKAVGVVVPAHDEEKLLPSCLASLHRAERVLRPEPAWPEEASREPVPVHLVVVADACRDRTAEIARQGGAAVVSIGARNVGEARAAGVREVLRRTRHLDQADVWVATTDADTLVPPGWLRRQVRHADDGWDTVAGTVYIADWSGHPAQVRSLFLERYGESKTWGDVGHPHVHGANLGFRASAYLRAGGFPAEPTGEDRALVALLTAAGARILRTDGVTVATSARRQCRAPHGFGDYLVGLASPG
ncbi:MAG TPA: glycosyltransferase [Trebonia sp.]